MAKILIIEDDFEVLENLSELLELKDYEVITATNGREGIKIAFEEFPDLVISDIMMPETNGYDVLKALKTSPNTYATPFIFLTAKAEDADRRSGMELGADDYLVKPFDNNEVIKAIEANLKKYRKIKSHYEKYLHELRSTFTKSLPHEFRTPLNSIMGFASMLRTSLDRFTPQEIDLMLANIHESGSRLLHLLENYNLYVDIMNLTSCEVIPDGQEMFLTDHIHNIARMYGRDKDIIDKVEHFSVKVSGKHFIKIIGELADNSFKFAAPETKVLIESYEKSGYIYYKFTNHGRGFTPEQIEYIGAFMQFDRCSFEQQGLGLGLAIVKKLVTLYDGKFEVCSKQGDTTTVIVGFLKA